MFDGKVAFQVPCCWQVVFKVKIITANFQSRSTAIDSDILQLHEKPLVFKQF